MSPAGTPKDGILEVMKKRLGPLAAEIEEDIAELKGLVERSGAQNVEAGLAAAHECLGELRRLGRFVKESQRFTSAD
jgi:hypothetical protein